MENPPKHPLRCTRYISQKINEWKLCLAWKSASLLWDSNAGIVCETVRVEISPGTVFHRLPT